MLRQKKIDHLEFSALHSAYWEALASVLNVEEISREGCHHHMSSKWKAAEYIEYMHSVCEYLPPKSVILDWGAQHGQVSLLLKLLDRTGIPYVVHPSDGVRRSLEMLFPDNYIIGTDPIKLPFSDGSLDGVISSGVIEHVDELGGDMKASLREIHRILKPAGLLFIWKLPLNSSISEIKSDFLGRWSHDTRFSPRQITRILNQQGFDVISSQYEGILPLSIKSIFRKMRLGFLENAIDRMAKHWPLSTFATDFFSIARKRA